MNVNPSTEISYETITETVPVITTTYESKTKFIKTEKQVYEVTLTQEQVDVIVAICGNVIGGGDTRCITDSIWEGLQNHSTRADTGWASRKYSFKDFFLVDTSSYNSRYLVTKDEE
jgi:hypothetical protein